MVKTCENAWQSPLSVSILYPVWRVPETHRIICPQQVEVSLLRRLKPSLNDKGRVVQTPHWLMGTWLDSDVGMHHAVHNYMLLRCCWSFWELLNVIEVEQGNKATLPSPAGVEKARNRFSVSQKRLSWPSDNPYQKVCFWVIGLFPSTWEHRGRSPVIHCWEGSHENTKQAFVGGWRSVAQKTDLTWGLKCHRFDHAFTVAWTLGLQGPS